jgi:hypothetical protein
MNIIFEKGESMASVRIFLNTLPTPGVALFFNDEQNTGKMSMFDNFIMCKQEGYC